MMFLRMHQCQEAERYVEDKCLPASGPIMQVKRRWIAYCCGRAWRLWQPMPVLHAMLLPGDTTGNKLIEKHDEKGRHTVVIEKGAPACTLLCFQCSAGVGKDADSVQ